MYCRSRGGGGSDDDQVQGYDVRLPGGPRSRRVRSAVVGSRVTCVTATEFHSERASADTDRSARRFFVGLTPNAVKLMKHDTASGRVGFPAGGGARTGPRALRFGTRVNILSPLYDNHYISVRDRKAAEIEWGTRGSVPLSLSVLLRRRVRHRYDVTSGRGGKNSVTRQVRAGRRLKD